MADTALTRARYAGLDWDTHGDDLRAQLQVKFAADFNDFVISSTGIMLLDLTAYGLSTLSFYLDRRATDTYLDTARTRKSVARTTRQLGYKMGGAVASGVDLDVSVTTPISVDVTIPKRFRFKGPDSLIFEVAQEVTWSPTEQLNDVVKSVRAYEGETVTEQFVADGTANQIFDMRRVPDTKYVVEGSVVVVVDGVTWTEVDLLEYGETNQFEVGYNDEPPTLRFGDGISGNIPESGVSIAVTYVASRGREGQVAADTINDVVTALVVNFNTIILDVTNPKAAVGGDAPEALGRAKAFAPKVYKSRYRAITAEDYDALAGSYADPLFGRVAVAKAISARSAANDLELQTLLQEIDDAIAAFHPTIAAQVTAANTQLTTQSTALTTATTAVTAANTELATIDTQLTTILTATRTAIANAADAAVDSTNIYTAATSGKAVVDALVTAVVLTPTQGASIKDWFDSILAYASSMTGTTLPAVTAAAGTVTTAVTTGRTAVTTGQAATATVSTALTTVSTARTALSTAVLAISTANTSVESDIDDATTALYEHVDAFLSEDCRANLVVVPILTLDAAGFYSAPSVGLVDSLQNYLDERKDVTHTVEVTSGANFLVEATITIRLGIKRGYSEQALKTAAEAAVDGLLRNREFGSPLYESDIEMRVKAIAGVVFTNVTITGPVGKLDSDGNLVVFDSEVITKGTVAVTPEIAA